MTDNSRSPSSAIPRVLGIGVAVRVSTSTSALSALNVSFCLTPKRCSSSMITSPNLLNLISGESNLCVPMIISASPFSKALRAAFISLVDWNRETSTIFTGQSANLFFHVVACCSDNRVVGAKTATCFPPITATKLALSATSVFPNPTSPQISRSIG